MSIAPGKLVGPYEIVALIGSGGMGEVYRARDTRLDRFVALKVLSPQLAVTPDLLERFRREARAVAALNHPNICTVHDIGQGSADSPAYLAMELIEGETLHQRLHMPPPLKMAEIVEIGTALADALDAAHSKGIVHRDLKPANIMLTPHGPKILDFGLAKAARSAAETALAVSGPLTEAGATVGTVAYMSPEQLRGENLDGRSDLFSLGLVLYEMIAGRPAFEGATTAVVSAAILNDAPPLPRTFRPELPERLEDTILKTLEKDRALRCQSASELRADFKRFARVFGPSSAPPVRSRSDPTSGASASPNAASAPSSVAPSSDAQLVAALVKRHRSGVSVALLVLVAAVVGIAVSWPRGGPDSTMPAGTATILSAAPFSLQNASVTRLTSTGTASLPALSPDGRYVAYVETVGDEQSLWIRQSATSSNVQIVASRPGVRIVATTVTPDGDFVDYVTVTQSPQVAYTLWRVPFLGGASRRLIENVHSGVAWSPDGQQLAFVRMRGGFAGGRDLVIADADGRNERVLISPDRTQPAFFSLANPSGIGHRLAWSPDGAVIASIGVGFPGGVLTGYAMFVTVADGRIEAVPQTPPGQIAWIDNSTLLQARAVSQAATWQLWRLAYPSGETSKLTNDLDGYPYVSTLAGGERFAAVRSEERADIWLGDGDGRNLRLAATSDRARVFDSSAMALAWASDRLLYTSRSGNSATVLESRLDGSAPEELLREAGGITITRDGQTLVYVSLEEGNLGWLWKSDGGGRRPEPLVRDVVMWPRLTPDNQVLYVTDLQARLVSLDGGESRLIAEINARAPDVSPDGRLLAFISLSASDELEIVVCAMPDCSAQRHFKPPGVTDPITRANAVRFTPDQTAVAYVNATAPANIWLQPLDGSAPRPLTEFEDDLSIFDFAWAADGQRLAIARGKVSTDIVLFSGLRAN